MTMKQEKQQLTREIKEALKGFARTGKLAEKSQVQVDNALSYSDVEDIFNEGECSVSDFFVELANDDAVTVNRILTALLALGADRSQMQYQYSEYNRLRVQLAAAIGAASGVEPPVDGQPMTETQEAVVADMLKVLSK